MSNIDVEVKTEEAEKVTTSCWGYYLGPLYIYTTDCGNEVEPHHKYCHQCGKKLIFPVDK